MVSINELLKPIKDPELIRVSGSAEKEDVDVVMAIGISRERVIRAAFKEVADQARRDTTMRTVISMSTKTEKIGKRTLGEHKENSVKGKIITYLDKEGESMTAQELKEKLTEHTEASVQIAISNLKMDGLLGASSERPARYFIKERGDPLLKDYLPTGSKTEVMR